MRGRWSSSFRSALRLRRIRGGLAVCLLLALADTTHASGFLVPTRAGRPGGREWSVRDVHVDAVVRGARARVTVKQTFVNAAPHTLETDYLFPVSPGASVTSMTLHEDDTTLAGELLRDGAARDVYRGLLQRRKDPRLIEFLGHDLFRVQRFAIPPRGTRTVVLRYDQALASADGVAAFAYPLRAAVVTGEAVAPVRVTLDVEAEARAKSRPCLGPVYSPSHDVRVTHEGPWRATMAFHGPVRENDPNFRVFWTTSANPIGVTLLTHWPEDEARGYFLCLASAVPEAAATQRIAADPPPTAVTFVVDTSASMAGDKLEQVRRALLRIIATLDPSVRFNVIAYNNTATALWPGARSLDEANRAAAAEFVRALRARDGTNMADALGGALRQPIPASRVATVIFVSDGRPTVGETNPERLLQQLATANQRRAVRIHTLGLGVDVDAVLLERLALDNGGGAEFVRPGEDIEARLTALYEQVHRPLLTNPVLRLGDVDASDVLPAALPDLFRGKRIVAVGRYARGGRTEVVLSGEAGSIEREYHYLMHANRRGEGETGDFPARVWALRRIARLIDEIRRGGSREEALAAEIVDLSTQYGVATEYTSFLAEEGEDHTQGSTNTRRALQRIRDLGTQVTGGTALAFSKNQAGRRSAGGRPVDPRGYWLSSRGDRDVERIEVPGVRHIVDRTFYYRRDRGWVDARVPNPAEADETIPLWSPRFFEVLESTTLAENAGLAQGAPLVMSIQGRTVQVTPAD